MDDLLKIRLLLDEAITYQDDEMARELALEGLRLAQDKTLPLVESGRSILLDKELLGEIEYFKGQLEILNENFKKAIAHFDRAIKFNPKDGASYNDRALCMIELGIIDGAMEYFDRGIKAEHDFATIHHNKGWLLNKLGRHTEAIRCFKKAIKFDSKRAVTYENLADALYNLGRPKDSIRAYKKALNLLNPKYIYIKKQLSNSITQIEQQFKVKT
jgi:tetratricopeptide (TPR) repeat protein